MGTIIDLFATDNIISCNVIAAKKFGLQSAIYLNELINIYNKALKKKKIDENGFFRLQRNYVTNRTTLSTKMQLEIDSDFENVELIEKSPIDVDLIKLDMEMYYSLLTNTNSILNNKVEKLMVKKSKSEKKADQKMAIVSNLKMSVNCSNDELRQLYYSWIEAIYEKPNGFLSKGAIKVFTDTINNYTKGDLDVAIELLKLAIIKAYTNAEWVINLYERDTNKLRTTQHRVDDSVELSDISY